MKTITLQETLPKVFAGEPHRRSDVWLSELSFERGRSYLVEAESGGGKSSMCAYIYGARTDYNGEIFFDTRNVAGLSINDWLETRRRHLAYLPQELSLFAELTAWENIQLKNRLTGHASDQRISQWMEQLGIADRRDYPAGRMSVGQQQRVAIIRSICQPFDFLLVDEPVSHLDPRNNAIAAAIVAEEAARQGAGIISTSVGNPLALDYDLKLKL